MNLIPDPAAIHSKGEILFANEAFAVMLGMRNTGDAVGRSLFDFAPVNLFLKGVLSVQFIIDCLKGMIPMDFIIPPEVMAETTCKHLCCLDADWKPDCFILGRLVKGILKNCCPGKTDCTYFQSLNGIEGFCWCPVRYEIHDRFGV